MYQCVSLIIYDSYPSMHTFCLTAHLVTHVVLAQHQLSHDVYRSYRIF